MLSPDEFRGHSEDLLGGGDRLASGQRSVQAEHTVIALLTAHNRREKTLAALRRFFGQQQANCNLQAVIVDDGSSDGTADAVMRAFPDVTLVRADGSLYWARGMALAESIALQKAPEYLLWLNDDVTLDPDALAILVSVHAGRPDAIVVGATRGPLSGEITYSALQRVGRHPLHFELIEPSSSSCSSSIECATLNGNVVLLHRSVYQRVGPIDRGFAHGGADYEYGLRARTLGVPIALAPRSVGVCARHPEPLPWLDTRRPVGYRVALFFSAKGAPPRSMARLLRRHGGSFWWFYWCSIYAVFLARTASAPIVGRLRSSPARPEYAAGVSRSHDIVGDG